MAALQWVVTAHEDAYAVGVVLAVVGLFAALVLSGRTGSAGEAPG